MEFVDAKQEEGQVVDEEDKRGEELENEYKPYLKGLLASKLDVDFGH